MTSSIACIPDWRADETLYSWVAGFHAIFGNGSARHTGALLFGTEHACREKDAPTNLHHFVEATRGELGDVGSILRVRTPIGMFIPFLPDSRRRVFNERLDNASGPGWRLLCGMPASCLEDTTTLRYCEACVADDMANWGLPRWRLPHQLTGAWVCLDHGLLLKMLKTNVSQWLLPPIESDSATAPMPDLLLADSLKRMAMLALHLVGVDQLDIGSIRQAVLVGLRDHGVTSWTHPLDKSQLATWFAQSPIATWMRTSHAPWQRLANGQWVHDLLRNRMGDHPLKWMLIWCTLFSDEVDLACIRRFINPVSVPHWDAHGQGTIWGASSSAVPLDIQKVITEAATLKDAAQSLGLTVFSLRRRLSELGTSAREFRLEASLGTRRDRAIETIDKYIATHPECSRSDVHRDCKAALAWMRVNAPEQISIMMQQVVDHFPLQLSMHFMVDHKSTLNEC